MFESIWNGIRSFLGLIVPFFAEVRDFKGWNRLLIWAIQISIFIVLMATAYILGERLNVKAHVHAPNAIRNYFLPWLVVLFYVLVWMFWWFWKILLEKDGESSDFPDIDQAWNAAVRDLRAAGIYVTDVPIYLVIGEPAQGEHALFQGSQIKFEVHTPHDVRSPIRLHANRDFLFISCSGTSGTGKLAQLVNHDEHVADTYAEEFASSEFGENDPLVQTMGKSLGADAMKSICATGSVGAALHILRDARKAGRDLNPDEIKALGEMAQKSRRQPRPLIKSEQEKNNLKARLRHLCRLIAQERRPVCPVNGILVVIPFLSTQHDDDSVEYSNMIRGDLTAAREALQITCPVYALLADLETQSGFSEFALRMSKTDKARRCGRSVPLGAEVDDSRMPGLIRDGLQYLIRGVLTDKVYDEAFQLENNVKLTLADVTKHNNQVYLFLTKLYRAEYRLADIVNNGILFQPMKPPLYGGCYLAATGKTEDMQAFLPGVFQKMKEDRGDFVSWTPAALTEDARYRSLTIYGYIALAVTVVFAVGLAALAKFRGG
jgi:hypothetical protein